MTKRPIHPITQEVAQQRFNEVFNGSELDSVTKSIIPIVGGAQPETLPDAYSRLPERRRVLSESVLVELGELLLQRSSAQK